MIGSPTYSLTREPRERGEPIMTILHCSTAREEAGRSEIDPESTSVPGISTAAVPWKADVLLSSSRAHPHPHRRAERSAADLSLPRTARVGNARPNGRIRSDPSRTVVRIRSERELVNRSSPHPWSKHSRIGDTLPCAESGADRIMRHGGVAEPVIQWHQG